MALVYRDKVRVSVVRLNLNPVYISFFCCLNHMTFLRFLYVLCAELITWRFSLYLVLVWSFTVFTSNMFSLHDKVNYNNKLIHLTYWRYFCGKLILFSCVKWECQTNMAIWTGLFQLNIRLKTVKCNIWCVRLCVNCVYEAHIAHSAP